MGKEIVNRSYTVILIILLGLILSAENSYAQAGMNKKDCKEELIALSKQKWQWMAEQNVDSLNNLFHNEAVFVHMGGTMNKEQELNTIKTGGIRYKHAEIKETSVRFIDNTAIVLDRIRLTAIVGGNEVVNPFMVTEVYVQVNGRWKLGSLSFIRLLGE